MAIAPEARERLADAMEQRLIELDRRWQDVAGRGNISLKTLYDVRKGTGNISVRTKRGIERGLQWPEGRVQQLIDGTKRPSAPPAPRGAGAFEVIPGSTGEFRTLGDVTSLEDQVTGLVETTFKPYIQRAASIIRAALVVDPAATGHSIFPDDQLLADTFDDEDLDGKYKLIMMGWYLFATEKAASRAG